jgi:hypothetical protein
LKITIAGRQINPALLGNIFAALETVHDFSDIAELWRQAS